VKSIGAIFILEYLDSEFVQVENECISHFRKVLLVLRRACLVIIQLCSGDIISHPAQLTLLTDFSGTEAAILTEVTLIVDGSLLDGLDPLEVILIPHKKLMSG
jgi:hypothetical protein